MAKSYVLREVDATGDKLATHETTAGEEVTSVILTDDENNALVGQKTKAESVPVTLPSDAGNLPVTVAGTADVDVVDRAARDLGKVDIAGIDAIGPVAGQKTKAASLPVVIASDQNAMPVSDNAGSLTVDGAVSIDAIGSIVDANNSTTTPLSIDAVFTGAGTDLLGYSAVTCTLYADVAGAADGMKFQFSMDNSNWDDSYGFTMDAGSTRRFQFPICARYFRIQFTNGGTEQAAFRVQTILHTANQLTSIHRLTNDMSPDRSAQVVKAAIFAQKAGTGDLTLVDATAAGNLKVSIEEAETDVPVTLDGEVVAVSSAGGTISQTPTITAGAYAADDAVGGLLTFADAARVSGGGGVVKDLLILDDAGQDAEVELWLFNATFTAMADNAPWAPSEADLRKLVAVITTGDGAWFDAGTPSVARIEASQRYDLAGTSLFGQLVTRDTPTFLATDDVSVILGLLQD